MDKEKLIEKLKNWKEYLERPSTRAKYAQLELYELDLILTSLTAPVDGKEYQIDFGNHLRCKLNVTDNQIKVEGAVNGWGNGVPLTDIVITELPKTPDAG